MWGSVSKKPRRFDVNTQQHSGLAFFSQPSALMAFVLSAFGSFLAFWHIL